MTRLGGALSAFALTLGSWSLAASATEAPPLPVPARFEPVIHKADADPIWVSDDSLSSNVSGMGRYTTGDILRFGLTDAPAPEALYIVTQYLAYCDNAELETRKRSIFDAKGSLIGEEKLNERWSDIDKDAASAERVIYDRLCADWDQYE